MTVHSSDEFCPQNSYLTLNSTATEELQVIGTCHQTLEQLMMNSYKAGSARLQEPKMELYRRAIHTGIFKVYSELTAWQWKSSPCTKDGSFLINYKMAFGALASGMLMEVYKRFSLAANFGTVTDDITEKKTAPILQRVVKESATRSKDEAITTEVQEGSTSIETDSTYSARRNAYCSNTFALGIKNHQIVGSEIISKQEEAITHRHEKLSTERVIATLQGKGLKFKNIVHDRNYQVSSIIETLNEDKGTEQNDMWHVIKSDMKKFSEIGKGLKRNENVNGVLNSQTNIKE